MGLDMYLNAKRHLWYNEDELADKVSVNFPELKGARVKQVVAEVMYWRKSNQIHKWFVDNVQEGTDDCGYYEVTREQLTELLQTITEVLEERDSSLLPPQSGFFFGSQDVNDWYWEDLTQTKDQLEKLLSQDMTGWWFEYHSSW